jgi:hypothetical protein
MATLAFSNPFRPGAGHMPPYLAGRQSETEEFQRLLKQQVILENMVLTGLRGVGKTVLLDTFKPIAMSENWIWVGADLSESSSLSEDRMAVRLMTDLAVATSSILIERKLISKMGFNPPKIAASRFLDFATMVAIYQQTPGLVADKLKTVLEFVWQSLRQHSGRGIIFAYDEAQNLADHAQSDEYPLSLLLDVFQAIQKKGTPFMLLLTGLPTLFSKLVEARTFAERMFHVVFLDRLNRADSRDAVQKPIQKASCPVALGDSLIRDIVEFSGGYPYFIQFLGREVYDFVLQKVDGRKPIRVPFDDIIRKLDTDFFAGRWSKATDRQRDLLTVVAHLENADAEFTVQDVVEESKARLKQPFSPSHVNQMFAKLGDSGLIYKNRHGKYSFAVPLMGRFILRQLKQERAR